MIVALSPPKAASTTGDIEKMTDAPRWLIRRVLDRGGVAVAERCGLYRVVGRDQLPAVLEALAAKGYPARTEVAS